MGMSVQARGYRWEWKPLPLRRLRRKQSGADCVVLVAETENSYLMGTHVRRALLSDRPLMGPVAIAHTWEHGSCPQVAVGQGESSTLIQKHWRKRNLMHTFTKHVVRRTGSRPSSSLPPPLHPMRPYDRGG